MMEDEKYMNDVRRIERREVKESERGRGRKCYVRGVEQRREELRHGFVKGFLDSRNR